MEASMEETYTRALGSGDIANVSYPLMEGDNSPLARAYYRLRLTSVPLTGDMDFSVQHHLVHLRFYPHSTQTLPVTLEDVQIRLQLLLQQISLQGEDQYLPASTFLYKVETAVRNMYILKHQLKSTYTTIPWEEMLFCLTLFISSQRGYTDSGTFFRYILKKEVIMECLKVFANPLKVFYESLPNLQMDKLGSLARYSRDELISLVLKENPEFQKLYSLYQKSRDLYSLEMMKKYIDAAVLAQRDTKTWGLAIKRALQTVGELLKDSTDSPNLSPATSTKLLQAAPPETRQILSTLRNSLSHTSILADASDDNTKTLYFNVQNDLKKIGNVISDILFMNRVEEIRNMLTQIIESNSLCEIDRILENLRIISIKDKADFSLMGVETNEDTQIEFLINDISKAIDKTNSESELFRHIRDIIQDSKYVVKRISEQYQLGWHMLKRFCDYSLRENVSDRDEKGIVQSRRKTASTIHKILLLEPTKRSLEIQNIQKLKEFLLDFHKSVEPRYPIEAPEILNLIKKIDHIFFKDKGAIKWIDQFKAQIDEHKPKRTRGKGKPSVLIITDLKPIKNKSKDKKLNNQNTLSIKTGNLDDTKTIGIKNKGVGKKSRIVSEGDKEIKNDVECIASDICNKLEKCEIELAYNEEIKSLQNNSQCEEGIVKNNFAKVIKNKGITKSTKLNQEECLVDMQKNIETGEDVDNQMNLVRTILIEQIDSKLTKLEDILRSNGCIQPRYTLPALTDTVRSAIEMLVLDILTNLEECLDGNILYMDDDVPLLTGKCLRNYLAHGNHVVDMLFPDTFITVLSNARCLLDNRAIIYSRKFGHIVNFNPTKLKEQYVESLNAIRYQENMLGAISNGSLEDLIKCIEKGANVNYKSACMSSTIHLAAAKSLEVVQFLSKRLGGVHFKNTIGQTALHIAAANGRVDIAQFLIDEGGLLINECDNLKKTPLHFGAQNGHDEIVQLLLDRGAIIDVQDINYETPLIFAVRNNRLTVVKFLFNDSITYDNDNVSSLLHIVSEYGYTEMAKYLISRKIDVNRKHFFYGHRPLHSAAGHGHLDIVNILIGEGADVNLSIISNGGTPLHCAAESGNTEIVKTLLEHNAKIDIRESIDDRTPLHVAVAKGHLETSDVLLKYGSNLNLKRSDEQTSLLIAAEMGHEHIVRLLFEYGSPKDDTDKRGYNALHFSAAGGYLSIVKFLIDNGFDIDSASFEKLTPLYLAVYMNELEVVGVLLDKGADVNWMRNDGKTPLHESALEGYYQISEILINNMANVNSIDNKGYAPIHYAAMKLDNEMLLKLLLDNGADVTLVSSDGFTPLHCASISGCIKAVQLLLKENNVDINAKDIEGGTTLHMAVINNHKAVVEILLNSSPPANVNAAMNNKSTALSIAVKNNLEDMVKLLIREKAQVNLEDGDLLVTAIKTGNRGIVETLLKAKDINASMNIDGENLLHIAVRQGNWNIVRILLKDGSIDINANNISGENPLSIAVQLSFKQCVDVLLDSGADTSSVTPEPLVHIAISGGNLEILEMLLRKNAKIIRNIDNQTPIEVAVSKGQFEVIPLLFKYQDINVNAKYIQGFTLLHIASAFGHLKIIEYLIQCKANLDIQNSTGMKPIHVAIQEGHLKIIDYFFKLGMSAVDVDINGITLLHYAAHIGRANICQYLVDKGADVNALDNNFRRPIHLAALQGHAEVLKILLKSGGIYNEPDAYGNRPIVYTTNVEIISILESTDKLFEAVENNEYLNVVKWIQKGACVNARFDKKFTPLHITANKDLEQICNILLKNEANPNICGEFDRTPLHYAAISSSIGIARALLASGAIYNPLDCKGQIPLDLATDEAVLKLFQLVDRCFENVENGDVQIISDLKQVTDMETVKAIMKACNRNGKSIVVIALLNNFPQTELLTQLFDENSGLNVNIARVLMFRQRYQEALIVYDKLLNLRAEMFGRSCPGYLNILKQKANILYSQSKYTEALELYEELYPKQTNILGENNEICLRTQTSIAQCQMALGQYEKAERVFSLIHQSQKNFSGNNPLDILWTRLHWATCIGTLGRTDEALEMNSETYETCQLIAKPTDSLTLSVLNNIAVGLSAQGKHSEAFDVFEKVYLANDILSGPNNSYTLRAKYNMAAAQAGMGDLQTALDTYQQVYGCQREYLGPDHLHTLESQYRIAAVLGLLNLETDKSDVLSDIYEQMKTQWGSEHPNVLLVEKIVRENKMKHDKFKKLEVIFSKNEQIDIISAVVSGNVNAVRELIQDGRNVNIAGECGKNSLQEAAARNYEEILEMLLADGANPAATCDEGNTALHYAVPHLTIVRRLLQHAHSKLHFEKFHDFINAKSHVRGLTALHIAAAKPKLLEVVRCLLQYGAWYDISDRVYNNPPIHASETEIYYLLEFINRLFNCAKSGDSSVIEDLRILDRGDVLAATMVRNGERKTVLKVALDNGHEELLMHLGDFLEEQCIDQFMSTLFGDHVIDIKSCLHYMIKF